MSESDLPQPAAPSPTTSDFEPIYPVEPPEDRPFVCSKTVGRLFAALAKAQGEFPHIEKTKTADAGQYAYDYADLAEIREKTAPILAKHGLGVLQPGTFTPTGQVVIKTILTHESGEWFCDDPLIMPAKHDGNPQKIGAALTYARRYAYSSLLGIAPRNEDTDAAEFRQEGDPTEHAPRSKTRRDGAPRQTRREPPADVQPAGTMRGSDLPDDPGEQTISGPEVKRLKDLLTGHKVNREEFGGYLLETYGYAKPNEIKRKDYDKICELASNFPKNVLAASELPDGAHDANGTPPGDLPLGGKQ